MQNPYLTFSLQSAWYAVNALWVREILRLPALNPIAEAPEYIVGVVNFRGKILPVMDLSVRLGRPQCPYHIADHVIILQQESRSFGMIVNEVHGVQEISPEIIEAPIVSASVCKSVSRFVKHLAKLDARAIMLLDHELLLNTTAEPGADVTHLSLTTPDVRWRDGTQHAYARHDGPAKVFETTHVFFPEATPREREILHERAQSLTSSLEEQTATQQIPLAIVGLSGEYFGVELETVREFTTLQRITPVPCCPAYIVGDMNLRGDILTVVDIRQVLQMPVIEVAPTAKVIVVPMGESLVGVLVDQVYDVFDLDPADLAAIPSAIKSINDAYLKGTVPCRGVMLTMLDLPKILAHGGLTVNEEA